MCPICKWNIVFKNEIIRHSRQDNVEQENNDLPFSSLPESYKVIVDLCPQAFDVEPEHNMDQLGIFDMQEMTSDEPPVKLL